MVSEHWIDKKSELEEKLVDGLGILKGLFEGIVNDKNFSTSDYTTKKIGEMNLTPNQMEFYQEVLLKINFAKYSVMRIEDEFGVESFDGDIFSKQFGQNFSRRIKNANKLYQGVTNNDAPEGTLAFSNNILVSFVLPSWDKEMGGYSFGATYGLRNSLINFSSFSVMPSKEVIQEKIKFNDWNFGAASLNYHPIISRIFGQENASEEIFDIIYRHELRHGFDHLIQKGTNDFEYSESQAHLFEGSVRPFFGFERDIHSFKKAIYGYFDYKENPSEAEIPDRAKELLDVKNPSYLENKINLLDNILIPNLKDSVIGINNLHQDSRETLSYLFSVSSLKQGAERVQSVVKKLHAKEEKYSDSYLV